MKEIGKFNIITNNQPDPNKVHQVEIFKNNLVKVYAKIANKTITAAIDEYASYLIIYTEERHATYAKKVLDILVELYNHENPTNKMANLIPDEYHPLPINENLM